MENNKVILDLLGCKHSITKHNWDLLFKDYKSVINGIPHVLMMTKKGTALVPVEINKGAKS